MLKHLVYRPNREVLGTLAAIERHLNGGPGTILLDELKLVRGEARERLRRLWLIGHERGAEISYMEGGQVKYVSAHVPMLGASVGRFLEEAEKSRTFTLEMVPCTEATRPEREYNVDPPIEELNAVYSFLHHWAPKVKLNPKPLIPAGMISRFADDVRGLLSIAESSGVEKESVGGGDMAIRKREG